MMANPEGTIRGDHGIGLCLSCVFEYKQAARARAAVKRGLPASPLGARPPQFAIALVPAPAPVPGPDGVIAGLTMVAVGACYDHIGIAQPAADGAGHER
jgi:hypothetical protein